MKIKYKVTDEVSCILHLPEQEVWGVLPGKVDG